MIRAGRRFQPKIFRTCRANKKGCMQRVLNTCVCLHAPKDRRPGRAYLAVPYDIAPVRVTASLDEQNLPMKVTLVHPV